MYMCPHPGLQLTLILGRQSTAFIRFAKGSMSLNTSKLLLNFYVYCVCMLEGGGTT